MKCEQIADLLPDYLQGNLPLEQARLVEAHMERCVSCSEEVAIWKKLALLPVERPSLVSRAHFEAMLDAYRTARGGPVEAVSSEVKQALGWAWLRSPLGALAWGVALLIFGIYIGTYVNDGRSRSAEMAAMHSELTSMRQLVVLSMLQQQSASERLQGVTWSRREEQLDPQVQSALLRTLRYDGSVDVRLAALDALGRHAGQPQIRKGVMDALQGQQSPLVQVALIDQLLEWRDPDAAQHLRKFQQSPNLNPAVRKRAEWAVSKLN
jgi:anti-sigma factor RsiW